MLIGLADQVPQSVAILGGQIDHAAALQDPVALLQQAALDRARLLVGASRGTPLQHQVEYDHVKAVVGVREKAVISTTGYGDVGTPLLPAALRREICLPGYNFQGVHGLDLLCDA
jgi:hypothetical protein